MKLASSHDHLIVNLRALRLTIFVILCTVALTTFVLLRRPLQLLKLALSYKDSLVWCSQSSATRTIRFCYPLLRKPGQIPDRHDQASANAAPPGLGRSHIEIVLQGAKHSWRPLSFDWVKVRIVIESNDVERRHGHSQVPEKAETKTKAKPSRPLLKLLRRLAACTALLLLRFLRVRTDLIDIQLLVMLRPGHKRVLASPPGAIDVLNDEQMTKALGLLDEPCLYRLRASDLTIQLAVLARAVRSSSPEVAAMSLKVTALSLEIPRCKSPLFTAPEISLTMTYDPLQPLRSFAERDEKSSCIRGLDISSTQAVTLDLSLSQSLTQLICVFTRLLARDQVGGAIEKPTRSEEALVLDPPERASQFDLNLTCRAGLILVVSDPTLVYAVTLRTDSLTLTSHICAWHNFDQEPWELLRTCPLAGGNVRRSTWSVLLFELCLSTSRRQRWDWWHLAGQTHAISESEQSVEQQIALLPGELSVRVVYDYLPDRVRKHLPYPLTESKYRQEVYIETHSTVDLYMTPGSVYYVYLLYQSTKKVYRSCRYSMTSNLQQWSEKKRIEVESQAANLSAEVFGIDADPNDTSHGCTNARSILDRAQGVEEMYAILRSRQRDLFSLKALGKLRILTSSLEPVMSCVEQERQADQILLAAPSGITVMAYVAEGSSASLPESLFLCPSVVASRSNQVAVSLAQLDDVVWTPFARGAGLGVRLPCDGSRIQIALTLLKVGSSDALADTLSQGIRDLINLYTHILLATSADRLARRHLSPFVRLMQDIRLAQNIEIIIDEVALQSSLLVLKAAGLRYFRDLSGTSNRGFILQFGALELASRLPATDVYCVLCSLESVRLFSGRFHTASLKDLPDKDSSLPPASHSDAFVHLTSPDNNESRGLNESRRPTLQSVSDQCSVSRMGSFDLAKVDIKDCIIDDSHLLPESFFPEDPPENADLLTSVDSADSRLDFKCVSLSADKATVNICPTPLTSIFDALEQVYVYIWLRLDGLWQYCPQMQALRDKERTDFGSSRSLVVSAFTTYTITLQQVLLRTVIADLCGPFSLHEVRDDADCSYRRSSESSPLQKTAHRRTHRYMQSSLSRCLYRFLFSGQPTRACPLQKRAVSHLMGILEKERDALRATDHKSRLIKFARPQEETVPTCLEYEQYTEVLHPIGPHVKSTALLTQLRLLYLPPLSLSDMPAELKPLTIALQPVSAVTQLGVCVAALRAQLPGLAIENGELAYTKFSQSQVLRIRDPARLEWKVDESSSGLLWTQRMLDLVSEAEIKFCADATPASPTNLKTEIYSTAPCRLTILSPTLELQCCFARSELTHTSSRLSVQSDTHLLARSTCLSKGEITLLRSDQLRLHWTASRILVDASPRVSVEVPLPLIANVYQTFSPLLALPWNRLDFHRKDSSLRQEAVPDRVLSPAQPVNTSEYNPFPPDDESTVVSPSGIGTSLELEIEIWELEIVSSNLQTYIESFKLEGRLRRDFEVPQFVSKWTFLSSTIWLQSFEHTSAVLSMGLIDLVICRRRQHLTADVSVESPFLRCHLPSVQASLRPIVYSLKLLMGLLRGGTFTSQSGRRGRSRVSSAPGGAGSTRGISAPTRRPSTTASTVTVWASNEPHDKSDPLKINIGLSAGYGLIHLTSLPVALGEPRGKSKRLKRDDSAKAEWSSARASTPLRPEVMETLLTFLSRERSKTFKVEASQWWMHVAKLDFSLGNLEPWSREMQCANDDHSWPRKNASVSRLSIDRVVVTRTRVFDTEGGRERDLLEFCFGALQNNEWLSEMLKPMMQFSLCATTQSCIGADARGASSMGDSSGGSQQSVTIPKLLVTIARQDFFHAKRTLEHLSGLMADCTKLVSTRCRLPPLASASPRHRTDRAAQKCWTLQVGQGSVSLEATSVSSLEQEVTPDVIKHFYAQLHSLRVPGLSASDARCMVRRLIDERARSKRSFVRSMICKVLVHFDSCAPLARTTVSVGDLLLQSTNEAVAKGGCTKLSAPGDPSVALAPLAEEYVFTRNTGFDPDNVLVWEASSMQVDERTVAALVSRKAKRGKLFHGRRHSLDSLPPLNSNSFASPDRQESHKPVFWRSEARHADGEVAYRVYEAIEVKVQPLRVNLSQKLLVEISTFFSSGDPPTKTNTPAELEQIEAHKTELLKVWQQTEEQLIGEASSENDSSSSLRTEPTDVSMLPSPNLLPPGGSPLPLPKAAPPRVRVFVHELRVNPLRFCLNYQGLLTVQEAPISLMPIQLQEISGMSLSALLYKDVCWDIMKAVVAQGLSSKVKGIVSRKSAQKKWARSNVEGQESFTSSTQPETRRRLKGLLPRRKIETADQMLQGFLMRRHQQSTQGPGSSIGLDSDPTWVRRSETPVRRRRFWVHSSTG